jgi:hypothetical protein
MKARVSEEYSWAVTYGEDVRGVADQVSVCWEAALKLESCVCVFVCVCIYIYIYSNPITGLDRP